MGERDRSLEKIAGIEHGAPNLEDLADDSRETIVGEYIAGLGFSDVSIEPAEVEFSEDEISEMVATLPDRLGQLGLEDPSSINVENVIELVDAGYMDANDIENLYFRVWDEFRAKTGPYSRIKVDMMIEESTLVDPIELKKEQDNEAVKFLAKLGVNTDELLDKSTSSDNVLRPVRRLGWLMSTEEALSETRKALIRTSKGAEPESFSLLQLAEQAQFIITDSEERLRSIDEIKLKRIDVIVRRAELKRLKHIKNLANSIVLDLKK